MTTKLMGTKVQRVEDQRMLRGLGRYVDDVAVGPDTLHAAVLRSPHAHARIVDIDVDEVLELEGVHAVWTYDDLGDLSPLMAEPLPLLIPHPDLTHGRTQYALAETRSTTWARRSRSWSPTTATSPRTPSAGSRSTTSSCPPVVGIDAARAADAPRARRRTRQRRRPDGAEHRRRRGRDRGRAAPAEPRPDHRAQRLHADGGPRHGRPLGPRHQPPAGVDLDPDLDRRPRRGRGQARPRPRPGRRDHPRRRRRLRREDQPPVARGAAGAAGGPDARPDREVHRGPARALHLLGPRARPGPPRRRRLRRRRPAARPGRDVLARPRRLHAVRPDRADHHLDPAARSLQAGASTGCASSRSTPTP